MSPYRTPADMPPAPRWRATFWPRLYVRLIWPAQRWLGTVAWRHREYDRQRRAYLVRLASWRATWGHREAGDDGRPAPTMPMPPIGMVWG